MNKENRVIIVTGGSRGLGLGIVRDLLEFGYRVATCSRTSSADIEELKNSLPPERFFWTSAEIGKEVDENVMFQQVVTWAGKDPLHGLVNNSGIAGEGILSTFPNADSEKIIAVNLLGALRLCRLAMRVMLARPHPARIISISSIVGSRGYTGLAAYSASKAGIDGFTRALAREVGRRGITVNSIAPGYFDSSISASLSDAQRQQIIKRTPLGRLAAVSDIVPVVRFLLSDDARFITGQTLVVDGGITC